MKIPVCFVLLVAITLICTPQAAVLAKEAAVVQLRLHGTYEDTLPPENPFGPRLLHFKGLLDLIREATADQNIAALYLKSESPKLGLAKVRELVQALQEFKAAGKRIYAFVEHAQLVDLLLISGADRIAFLSAADLKALDLIDTIAPHDLFWASVKANLGVDTLKLVTNYGRKAFNVDMQNPFALLKFLCPAY